ncbi:head-tail adaptor Ad1 [Streptomyces phage Tefunt]|uniref:Head-to-tail adaptor n=1 Tax=Streptomyces phage Tefunt TaxID=2041209 RepID=A0A291LHY9_9CAUD|nr:head-tail adaptor Ad1 [Streptomyces phage Tefunt]ATI18951.1 head-to-tail adaptor [Streptomyces phage Tefunt]QAY15752.1 head-to-tail adaptor [Streptomyces phage Nishikigoi]
MAIFATLEELKGRLDWTLDTDEERIATSALEDASDLASYYARRDWPDAASAPRLVRTLVLKACKRYMDNPSGYTQSRAGDETLGWNDASGENAGTVYFTDDEQKLLSEIGGKKPGLHSAGVSAWGSNIRRYRNRAYPVPVDVAGQKVFPFYADEEEPW